MGGIKVSELPEAMPLTGDEVILGVQELDSVKIPTKELVIKTELAAPGGAALVGQGVMAVNTIADLLALPAGQRKADMRYLVKEYHAGTGVGGGEFYWDGSSIESDNSGTVFAIVGASTGRFKRKVERLSITDFGAIGDGVQDDTIAVQKAVNYSQIVGLDLHVPAGIFKVNSISVNRDDGKRALSIKGAGPTLSEFCGNSSSQRDIFDVTGRGHNFFDFTLAGTVDGSRAVAVGIFADYTPNIHLSSITARGFTKYGLGVFRNAWSSSFYRCQATYNDNSGIFFVGNVHNTQLNKCYFGPNTGIAAVINNSSSVSFISCGFETNPKGAVLLSRTFNSNFYGCYFEGNGTEGTVFTNLEGLRSHLAKSNIIINGNAGEIGVEGDVDLIYTSITTIYRHYENNVARVTSITASSVTNNLVEGAALDISFVEVFSSEGLTVDTAWGSGGSLSCGVRLVFVARGTAEGAGSGRVEVKNLIGFSNKPVDTLLISPTYTSSEGGISSENRFQIKQFNTLNNIDLTEATNRVATGTGLLTISKLTSTFENNSIFKVEAQEATARTRGYGFSFAENEFEGLDGKVVYVLLKYRSHGNAHAIPYLLGNAAGVGNVRSPVKKEDADGFILSYPVLFRYDKSLPVGLGFFLENIINPLEDYVEISQIILTPIGVNATEL